MREKYAIGIVFLSASFIFGSFLLYISIYNSLFRFNQSSLESYLSSENRIVCTTLSGCELVPGDILVRRYLTDRTRLITSITDSYFNHTAYYMGSGMIFEAVGSEKNPNDDIIIHPLHSTDWSDIGIERLLVIRPKYNHSQLTQIKKNLEQIAEDPDYRFGLSFFGEKKTYCSEVIYRELIGVGIIGDSHVEFLLTPDRLVLEIGT